MIPIALFVYNRVEELKKTLKALQANYLFAESDLYIYSDAPKNEKDIIKVNEVRKFIKTINGCKKLVVYESKENKGLAKSIIYGVTKVLENHKQVIVMEDDLITSNNFLDFMNQALKFYENDLSILSISGYTLNLKSLPNDRDYYFGYRASSWGWGCWKDRWDKIDWNVSDYDSFIKEKSKKKDFKRGGSDMLRMLKNYKMGIIDSWAIRFCYHQFKNDLKTVFPSISKVQSIGFSEEATHTNGTKRFITELDSGKKRKFKFQKFKNVDNQLAKEFRNKFSVKARIIDKFRKVLGI